jgi:hypothetical protein
MIDPHINYDPDWETPPQWLAWAEATLGGPFFDPCPARPTFDGLVVPWGPLSYVNPPGANSVVSVKPWWEAAGRQTNLRHLVWCFFNCEASRHLDPNPWNLRGTMVIPHRRLRFYRDGKVGNQPRNWAWFWTTRLIGEVATPPESSWVLPTGGWSP